MEQAELTELLTSMFIDNHRTAREMDDMEEEEDNLVEEEEDEEDTAMETAASSDPQEIARFNNYMDAIYR